MAIKGPKSTHLEILNRFLEIGIAQMTTALPIKEESNETLSGTYDYLQEKCMDSQLI